MNPVLLRYVGFVLAAVIAGAGGGYLAVNKTNRPTPPSGTVVAVPAQPFPGQGIRAVPAIPAQPKKGKPDIGNTSISYIQGEAKKNQVVNPAYSIYSASAYLGTSISHKIVGMNFSDKNTIYWDNKVLARDMPSTENTDGTQEIFLPIPTDIALGSFHTVSVKNQYGASNAVQVQVVEHFVVPAFVGVKPSKESVGMQGKANIWDSLDFSCCLGQFGDAPLTRKMYLGLQVPASMVKSGAAGMANIFIPTPLQRTDAEPLSVQYAFTLPKEAVYCPSWAWDAKECTLAAQDTLVPIMPTPSSVYAYSVIVYYVYDFQYRGIEKGLAIGVDSLGADIDTLNSGGWPWSGSIIVTP